MGENRYGGDFVGMHFIRMQALEGLHKGPLGVATRSTIPPNWTTLNYQGCIECMQAGKTPKDKMKSE